MKKQHGTTTTSCPYSTVSSKEEKQGEESSSSFSDLIQSCPAFEESCPFSKTSNATEIQQVLLKVPKSHYPSHSPFQKALQHLHHVHTSHDDFFQFSSGQCPMQGYHTNESFGQVMEECSLASIMARMASDIEEQQQGEAATEAPVEQSGDEDKNDGLAGASAKRAVHKDDTEPSAQGLAHALKTGTAASHEAAEHVHFVQEFIRGKIDPNLYRSLVLALYFVYREMEVQLNQHAPSHFGSCHFPKELSRTEALEEDVDYWLGSNHKSLMPPSPATRDYLDRLALLADTNPLLLLSHAYTRYLGDLSGGKILARKARRALNLEKDEGLAFYRFDSIPSAKLFKDQYRKALDELELSHAQVVELVQEANVAFLLNMRIFQELDVQAGVSKSLPPLEEELAKITMVHQENNAAPSTKNEEPCPFAKKSSPSTTTTTTTTTKEARCPWPFVLLHDPRAGLQDWQTWVVVGLLSCWLWSRVVQAWN